MKFDDMVSCLSVALSRARNVVFSLVCSSLLVFVCVSFEGVCTEVLGKSTAVGELSHGSVCIPFVYVVFVVDEKCRDK